MYIIQHQVLSHSGSRLVSHHEDDRYTCTMQTAALHKNEVLGVFKADRIELKQGVNR
jgi:hypothetical protein